MKRSTTAAFSSLCFLGLFSAFSGEVTAAPQVSCYIYLGYNGYLTHTCSGISDIKILRLTRRSDGVSESVAQITLDKKVDPYYGYSEAVFDVYYNQVPVSGSWTVNIGDSITNNGWKGDSRTQSFDAEMQILGTEMSVYGNDTYCSSQSSCPLYSYKIPTMPFPYGIAGWKTFLVKDQYIGWSNNYNESFRNIISKYLYNLRGEYDQEQGGTNYNIYAAFNRVISPYNGPASRTGKGVSLVRVTLR